MEIKLNMDNLTEQERNTLMGLVEKANKTKAWKPKYREVYYAININGEIVRCVWYGLALDEVRYATGNCYKTREEAEFAVEKLKVIAELKRFAEEHNEKMVWDTAAISKYLLIYSHKDKRVDTTDCKFLQSGNINFTSREIARKAIETIGADRLKKYYFEVED